MIVRVIHTEGGSGASDASVAMLNEVVIPDLKKRPGFVAGYWIVDGAGRVVAFNLWEDAESDAANEARVEAVRKENLEKVGLSISKSEVHKVIAHTR